MPSAIRRSTKTVEAEVYENNASLVVYKEQGREREREREKIMCVSNQSCFNVLRSSEMKGIVKERKKGRSFD